MADTSPPGNVTDLLRKVRQSTGNIQKHRDAMAALAAELHPDKQQAQGTEVKQ